MRWLRSLRARRGTRTEEMTCREAVGLLAEYLDDALTGDDRAGLESHLRACGNCAEHLAQIRAAVRLAGAGAAGPDVDPGTVSALTDLYRSWRDPL